jgi:predicted GNAT family acetyltransferase
MHLVDTGKSACVEGSKSGRIWQAGRVLTLEARLLGDAERAAVERILDRAPFAAAQVAEQVATFGLEWWRADARVFGYGHRRQLESVCWLGANVMPVNANPGAIAAFAEMAAMNPRQASSIVGPANPVLDLWDRLAEVWGPAREVRSNQPLLATGAPPATYADPAVRLVRRDELDLLFPAAVAMYTEEVGVSPVAGRGSYSYRQRIGDLVNARRAYARFIDGRVVFKAELAIVTRHTAQVQGVWVHPDYRGRGIAVAGMAAVVRDALRRVAPTVSLYVNDYNHPARRVYERCGFKQVDTFASVLF